MHKTTRRTGLAKRIAVVAMTAAGSLLPAYAVAQNYPEKPIRFILPFAAGGTTDALARPIAQKLTAALGQSVVAENRPGAGGNIAGEIVARAAPDGYTILMGVVGLMSANVTLYAGKMPYNPEKDFTPITLVAKVPLVLSVHPSLPVKDFKGFIAFAKTNPGKLNFGSAGTGSTNHLVGEMLNTETGISMVHVPYKGGAAATVALLSGQIEVLITPPPNLLPMVKAGRIRALAVSTARRSPAMPSVPTIAESGLPGFEATSWFCIAAPAGLPKPVLNLLHTEFVKILNSPEIRDRLVAEGADVETSTPEELAAFIRSEISKWAKVIRSSGAKAE